MPALLFGLAFLALILIPWMPQLVRLRIRLLRWLRWTWAVTVLEKHFDRWVLFFRALVLVIAAVLCYAGWKSLHD